ncbi:MAG: T9SS type A sorting domain-containing protein [Ignavibacteria bacterium]|nr:T9SS type A sorting domain-containing protein [Ignavibacteria bacterium]
MKKFIFLYLCLTVLTVRFSSISAQEIPNHSTQTSNTILVTFSVDMELERLAGYFHPASDTVSIGGNFNAWGKTNMTASLSNSDIYNTTVSITASVQDTIRFSFFHSPNNWENVGIRKHIVTQDDYNNGAILLDAVGFNSDFPQPQLGIVTFNCNMIAPLKSGKIIPGDKVFVRGDFNSWSGYDYELKDIDGDSIYSANFYSFKDSQYIEFKFLYNHGGYDIWETTANRTLTVSFYGVNIFTAYWEDFDITIPRKTIQVTFSVNMELERLAGLFNPQADSVSVRGSFNGWSQTIMAPTSDNTDIYRVVIPNIVAVDDVIEFKFFYSPGTWESIENRRHAITQNDFDSGFVDLNTVSFNNYCFSCPYHYKQKVKFTCNTNGSKIVNAPAETKFQTVHILGVPSKEFNIEKFLPDSVKSIQLFDDGINGDAVAGDKIFSVDTVLTFAIYDLFPQSFIISYKYSANYNLPTNGGTNDNEDIGGGYHKSYFQPYSAIITDTFGIVNITKVEQDDIIPVAYKLEQNYPNPFNPETKISWQLAAGSFVTLKIYDVLGNEVAVLVNEEQPAGTYQVNFKTQLTTNSAFGGKQLSSGIYFYQLRAGDFVQTKKMILLR